MKQRVDSLGEKSFLKINKSLNKLAKKEERRYKLIKLGKSKDVSQKRPVKSRESLQCTFKTNVL